MPHNKTYLSSIDKERKRLTKIELSSIDNLRDSLNQLEDQIDSVNAAFDLTIKADNFLSESITDVQDLGDKLTIALNDLKQDLEAYNDFAESLEDVTTKLRDLYEMKTLDVVSDFKRNADALGIDPTDVKEYVNVVNLNEDAKEVTNKAFRRINDESGTAEADRLIDEYK